MKSVRRDRIDGVLLLDKPNGLSSNHAMLTARRLLVAAKAGHGGTLDPMATGLLPLLLGEATKFSSDLLEADKTYLAQVTLGATTDTADAMGNVLERLPVQCNEAQVRSAAAAFVGPQQQVPPMYSALKRAGRPLYSYAREGIEVERAARDVTIHSIEVVSVELPRVELRVRCSKGTYVRTLAEDLGRALGCGAHLSALRREQVGALSIVDAVTIDALEALPLDERRAHLRATDSLLTKLPRVELDSEFAVRFGHGQKLPFSNLDAERVRVYADGRLLGVATVSQGVLAPLRLISMELQ